MQTIVATLRRGAFFLFGALSACQPSGSDRAHTALDSTLEALRAAFNADSGKVRVIMLAAPT